MNLKFVTIPPNLLKCWFSGKVFKLNHHFHFGTVPISQYQEALNSIYSVIKHRPSPLSIHIFSQMTRYYYFSLGSLPPSGHGALQCCVMSYLAIWHLLIAFLGFVPYLPLASSALKTKLLICLWFFILQSVCFSDIYYIYFHYILGV